MKMEENFRLLYKERDLGRKDADFRWRQRLPKENRRNMTARDAGRLICEDRHATGWEFRWQADYLSSFGDDLELWKKQKTGKRRNIQETTYRYKV
jgi:hypothetical protein